jgi:hypothetical protein
MLNPTQEALSLAFLGEHSQVVTVMCPSDGGRGNSAIDLAFD